MMKVMSPSKRRQYWRRNLAAIVVLLTAWGLVSFGVAFYARELGSINFFGWPFSYWIGAQGALLVFLFIVVIYARYMNRLDRRFGLDSAGEAIGVDEGTDE